MVVFMYSVKTIVKYHIYLNNYIWFTSNLRDHDICYNYFTVKKHIIELFIESVTIL